MVADRLAARAEEIDVKLTLIDKEVGYELRCADPIPFDAEYTRDLGYGAVKFLRTEAARTGAIIYFAGGRLDPLPFEVVIAPDGGSVQPRRVDIDGEAFACALQYMIRLERDDFEDPARLASVSAAAKMTPDEFRQRFGYVVGWPGTWREESSQTSRGA